MNEVFRESASAAGGITRILVNTTATATTTTSGAPTAALRTVNKRAASATKSVENAVYGHIRAVRSLGRTEVFPSEIAEALGLSVPIVIRALRDLQKKGVKFDK